MNDLRAHIAADSAAPQLPFFRWSRWASGRWIIVYFVIGVGYLARILSARRLTLAGFLLLTAIYGAWLVMFHVRYVSSARPARWRLLTLLCLALAVASQFLALPGADLNWLPILPIATACLTVGVTRQQWSLIAAAFLWLSSSLAFILAQRTWDVDSQLLLLFTYASFVGMSVAIRELTLAHQALERSNTELAQAHTQLQEYSAQVEEIGAVRERNRIAREIHDTLGHSLTLLAVQLETATQFESRGDPSLRQELQEARRVAKACLTDVRRSVEALRPDGQSTGSLQERLRELVAEFATVCHETTITLDVEEVIRPLSPDITGVLYRCAQEALTNVRKHARATKALLYLSTSGGPDGYVELSVLDNGRGLATENEERTSGFGLIGMRERVALLEGAVKAGPEPGRGWRVEVMIPLGRQGNSEPLVHASHALIAGERDV